MGTVRISGGVAPRCREVVESKALSGYAMHRIPWTPIPGLFVAFANVSVRSTGQTCVGGRDSRLISSVAHRFTDHRNGRRLQLRPIGLGGDR